MINNINFSKIFFSLLLLTDFIVFGTCDVYAQQCNAGTDKTITICGLEDNDLAPGGVVDLFAQIGEHDLGGTWSANIEKSGLQTTTGTLNILKIKKSGIHIYTYTVTCANNNTISSKVTLNLGPYLGAGNGGTVCSDDSSVNLFQFLIGEEDHHTHENGLWTSRNNSAGAAINGFTFDATQVDVNKSYDFTYTLDAVAGCTQDPITISLRVSRAAKEGTPRDDLIFCETEDLSRYTELDLFDRIYDEDADGTWSDLSNTGQLLKSKTGSTINIREIVENRGPGIYTFSYRVEPEESTVCNPKTANVNIVIKKVIDLDGATLAITPEICLEEFEATDSFTATLTQRSKLIPDGNYTISYNVGSKTINDVGITFKDGVATFPIDKNDVDAEKKLTVKIISITTTIENTCSNIGQEIKASLTIKPAPDNMENAKLSAESVCFGETITINITNHQLSYGNYIFTYDLSGKNTATNQEIDVNVNNSSFYFVVPANLIPNPGITIIAIKSVKYKEGCSVVASDKASTTFTINERIDLSEAELKLDNGISCQSNDLNVTLSGLSPLTNISLTYDASGANTIDNQVLQLTVSNGRVEFIVDKALLPNLGDTTLRIVSINDNTQGSCLTLFPTILPEKTIELYGEPEVPEVPNLEIEFCGAKRPTLEDLNTIIIGLNNTVSNQFLWFNDYSSITPLPINTLLTSKTYWVVRKSNEGCISEKKAVSVIIHQVTIPTLKSNGELFCGLDKPRISDLSKNVSADGTINWFDSELDGNPILTTELLRDGYTYYGFNVYEITGCMSEKPIAVTVSLTNCDAEENDFFIPDGFSPDGNGINDAFIIPNIGYIYPNYTLEIFNRHGDILYRGNKNTPPWDGRSSNSSTIGGGIVPNGVYFYILNFNKENRPPKQGHLYLKR